MDLGIEKRVAGCAAKLITVYCLLFFGCATVPIVDRTTAARALDRAKRLYQEGNFQAAKVAFQTYRGGQALPDRLAEAFYWEGMCLLAQRDFGPAREKLESALEQKIGGWLEVYILCALGESLMGLGEFADAQGAYSKAIEASPEDIRLDHVLLRIATCAQRRNNWEEADGFLKRLLSECVKSPLRDVAREKLQYGSRRFFTVQVGAFKTGEAARKRAAELKKQGLGAFVGQIERGGEQLHCVWIGRYENWREANLEMQRIRGLGRIENAIVKP